MVHIAYFTVKILRANGVAADYLAISKPGKWKADFHFPKSFGHLSAKERFREFFFFWRVVARYPIIHSHFMITMSQSAWEMKFFRLMGGKWVVHARGCSERERDVNISLHPRMNICQDCDYNATICTNPVNRYRRAMTAHYADFRIVTTPDLKDFMHNGVHVPFFCPPLDPASVTATEKPARPFVIVHVTNHPGIEGSRYIEKAIENLRQDGYEIEFHFLSDMHNDEVLQFYRKAHLSIGKMKMGYYANAQIESLYFGVPAITYVRKEFVTPEIEQSGLILADLDTLQDTIRYYIDHPDALAEKTRIAHASVTKLHNNTRIAARYREIYESLTA